MEKKSILTANKDAKINLEKYIKTGEFSDLKKAFDLDNTDSTVLFYYLKYLKTNEKDDKNYLNELKKYKFFLDKDSCDKLEIEYIDHKKDILSLLVEIRKVDENDLLNLDIWSDALDKCYSIEDKKILDQKYDQRINNVPLTDIFNNDILYYLSIKIMIGKHLYSLVNMEYTKSQIEYVKNAVCYFVIYSEILHYYLIKEEKILLFNLVNLLDLCDYFDANIGSITRLNYYLDEIKFDLKDLKIKKGLLYSELSKVNAGKIKITKMEGTLDAYKDLFIEIMEKILKSNCIKELIAKLKNHHRDEGDLISIDENFIQYFKNSIIFFPFFRDITFAQTIPLNGKIMFNNVIRIIEFSSNYIFLFNFCLLIITGIHESIGHLLKDYFYYVTRFFISEESPKKEDSDGNQDAEEGGFLVEDLLFSVSKLYLSDVLYILDINNWQKSLKEFSSYFTSDLRNKIIKNEIMSEELLNSLNLSDECLNLLTKFELNKYNLIGMKTFK